MPKPIHPRPSNHRVEIAPSQPAVWLFSAGQHATIVGDLEAIARGEELDIPWRRVRKLLDLGLAEILYPVMTAGSRRALSLTDTGLAFFDQPLPPE
ncbi:MAG: hypothetical protein R3D70_23800 [Rhizobiaceae bacterium]